MSYDQLDERYKAVILYHVNKCPVTYMATCFQCGLSYVFDLQVHPEYKQTLCSVCHIHPRACRLKQSNGAVLRMRQEKPRSRVTAGVA
jgi:hypothetical protein